MIYAESMDHVLSQSHPETSIGDVSAPVCLNYAKYGFPR